MVEVYFDDISPVDGNPYGSAPATEPVSLTDIKAHLYIDGTQDDTLLTSLNTAARSAVEQYCHVSLVDKTITAYISFENKPDILFRSSSTMAPAYVEFELPLGPVTGIASVTTINSDNTITSLVLNTDYWIFGGLFQKIRISNSFDNVIIAYYTGWATPPADLLLAIKAQCAFYFENRGEEVNRYAAQNVGLSEVAEYLASRHKRLTTI